MMMRIVKYGETLLREKAQQVLKVDDAVRKLAKDMLDTMYAARGVGLAAEQVGRTERMCVVDVPPDAEKEAYRESNAKAVKMPLVLINPVITKREGTQRNDEGCLSFPDISAPITRANKVTVEYLDADGKPSSATAQGLLARAIQHEIDHLDGVLLIDKFSRLQRLSMAGRLKRLEKENSSAAK